MPDTITRRAAFTGAATVALAAAAVATAPVAAEAAQPNMQDALASLVSARRSLERAPANKGGHRQRAMRLIDQAIDEVQQGIRYAG